MKYDLDTVIDRCGTGSAKWDYCDQRFGVKGLLPMWVADMDFPAPAPIIDAIKKAADVRYFGYFHVADSYYDALIDWMKRRHQWEIKKEWVVFSPGVVTALYMAVRAFTRPGDQVILQTPIYTPFFNAVRDNRRSILDSPLRLENGLYTMDFDDLRRKLTPRTKMIILCSPQNPIGRVWRKEEMEELAEICAENNIMVISDEIHQDLVYSGHKHIPFPLAADKMQDKWIVCTSGSKTFNLPGMQMSNIIIADPKIRARFESTMRKSAIHAPNIIAPAATEAAYRYCEDWLDQVTRYLEGNVAYLQKYAAERIPGLKITQPQGTYLMWLDFRACGIPPEKLGQFCREEAKVGIQAGAAFGAKEDGFERMNIACPRATLEEGLRRLESAVKRLRVV